jgi:integrase
VDERCVEVAGRFEWGSTKTAGAERVVDLPALLVAPLAGHLLRFPPLRDTAEPNTGGLLFYGKRKGVVRRHVFCADWRRACESAKVGHVRLEWLRHTGASLAYAATKDTKAVAARLGHTSTRMIDTVYVGLYQDASLAVADALDALVEASLEASDR